MATLTTNLVCDLQKPLKINYLDGNLFSLDNGGNTINVFIMDGDQPAQISGDISANVIRPDGSTVAVTGALDGNRAYIILPQACYAISGTISIVIKNTDGTTVTTIGAIVANVYLSSTDTVVDPSTILPSIQYLLSEIATAVASIPADYSSLWTKLAPAFSTDKNYVAGQYVTYDGGLYRFNTVHSGAWSASDVDAVDIGTELKTLNDSISDIDSADSLFLNGGNALNLSDITENCRIRISDGAETSANTFFSTGFIPVRQGKIVTINHTYDSSTYGSVFYDDQKNKVAGYPSTASNKEMIAPAGSAFFRTIFLNSDSQTASVFITTPLIDSIENRLSNTEDITSKVESNMYSAFDIDWGVNSSGDFHYGWRAGYWGDDGTRSSSTSYIMSVNLISSYDGFRPVLAGGVYAKVQLPEGKTNLVVKAFDKTTSELVKRFDVASGDTFEILSDCKYGFHMSGEASEITESFVNAIKVTVFYRIAHDLRPYSEKYEHFTVSVSSKWANPLDTTTDDNESAPDLNVLGVITLPNSYTPHGKPTPLIMMCHGYNGYVTEQYWNGNGSDFIALLDAFKTAGFAVFDVDNTRANTSGYGDWGSLPIMSAYVKAWEYIKQNYNVEDRLYLYSYSMGTTVALNMLKWYGSEIVTSVQTACRPICQIRYEALEDTDIRKKQIAVAFGLCTEEDTESENWAAPAWDTTRLRGFNQYEERLTVGNVDIINMKTSPVKVMIGANDTEFQTEAIAYYNALANNGNFVNMRIVDGMNHGAIGYLTNANLREEVVRWFNRFR
jgi:hypothetical protein